MAGLGSKDHRLAGPRQIEYRLQQLIKGWKVSDPAPDRVKPAPLSLVRMASASARQAGDVFSQATADLTEIAFFYLCRPGEYALSTEESRSSPFRLCDVDLRQGSRRLDTLQASEAEILSASFGLLTYTDQKNAVRGEQIGHGRTRDPHLGPVQALGRRILHLRQHNAPPDTPLHAVYCNGRWTNVRSRHITDALRLAAIACFPTTGISPDDISARSLRAGGAMALLCARVDSDIIRLVGRWRSDEMFRYLHAQAYPLMHTFAQQMFNAGSFSLLPGQSIPAPAAPLLNQVPL